MCEKCRLRLEGGNAIRWESPSGPLNTNFTFECVVEWHAMFHWMNEYWQAVTDVYKCPLPLSVFSFITTHPPIQIFERPQIPSSN